jgi:SsrA-binding protein
VPKEQGEKVVATNRKARHDYSIEDTYEAGLVLSGTEVKSLRMGRASLVDGYGFIDGGEAWLDAVHIPEYSQGTWTNHPPRRKRKMLLHKAQIIKISQKVKEGGYTLVPFLTGAPKSSSRSRKARKSTTSGTLCVSAKTSARPIARCARATAWASRAAYAHECERAPLACDEAPVDRDVDHDRLGAQRETAGPARIHRHGHRLLEARLRAHAR